MISDEDVDKENGLGKNVEKSQRQHIQTNNRGGAWRGVVGRGGAATERRARGSLK